MLSVLELRACGLSGIVVHRRALDPRDITRHRGIPVTTPARTLLDLAATLHPAALRRAVRQAYASGRVNHRQLVELLGRTPGRPGALALRRLVADGPTPTRSELEDAVLALVVGAGIPRPDVNLPIVVQRRRIVPDFRWSELKLVVEADGAAWHDDPLARADDAERQALLEAAGERVLRVTWTQAIARPAQTLAHRRGSG